ncbi:polymer-forming cytoskeletal protein [Dysgonomonas sp. GY617]|uniref:bactofilin family protein n=1 Tax=Dysgonomonas sp. GY617 TaxID=2780420 RepID=UPI0018837F5B|nr:polymer-forming cytoskeletal protein [Dysgonomonas sp. GY617]MBF0577148.1 polymer-forming cytoskeletal protein [Dysgonomonas sp. GY617]
MKRINFFKKESKQETEYQYNDISLLTIKTKIEGSLSCMGDLRTDAQVEGDVNCQGRLIIGSTGIIAGKVIGQSVDCSGLILGDVLAIKELIVRCDSRIEGSLKTADLEVEKGSSLIGHCNVNPI